MKQEKVSVTTNDGPMNLHVFYPVEHSLPVPSIIILQEAFGVNDNIRDIGKKFSEAGYLAIIPELFHRISDELEIPYKEKTRVMAVLGSLTNEELMEDVKAAFLFLKGTRSIPVSSIGVIGFCMGGFTAMLAACRLPLKFAISCYGGGISDERAGIGFQPFMGEFKKIKCPVFLLYGETDQSIPQDQVELVRESLRNAQVEYELKVYLGAGHAFLREGEATYHPTAAKEAWNDIFGWLKLQKSC